ncbi:hypothetical protein C8J57DRAFT_1253666 [Mycena rebaudengoi]|nr:hypothetical protein C8J57DRAFT_1253666 [Mycena rebaudengoi]
MAQGDYELLQYIGRLPPNTSAEEIIRLKSRLVCGFIDVARPHTYCDDLKDTLHTVDSMAFDAPDGEQCIEIPTDIPPLPRGDQFCKRFFSYHAVRQGPLHMAALKTEYDLDPMRYSYIATMWVCLLEGLRLLARYTGQRLWEVDLAILHRIGTSPLPFFHDFEYAQLRLLGDACDAFGDAEVYDLIDRISRLRFRKNSLLTHMLHSGLLDPVYDNDKSSRWRSNTPSDLEGADVLGNPDSSSSDSAPFHQPVE